MDFIFGTLFIVVLVAMLVSTYLLPTLEVLRDMLQWFDGFGDKDESEK